MVEAGPHRGATGPTDVTRGDHQQDGGDEQQRDRKLDLRRGAGGLLMEGASAVGPRVLGERGERRRQGRTVAIGASDRGGQQSDRRQRKAALQGCERLGTRHAERQPLGDRPQLCRDESAAVPADFRQRTPHRQSGDDRDAQQVQHVGELQRSAGGAPARAAGEPQVRGQQAGSGCGRERNDCEAQWEAGKRRRGDERGRGARAALDRHRVGRAHMSTQGRPPPGAS